METPLNPKFPSRKLLDWFKLNARPLPWRVKYDPYEVVVSEFMLQQTQVVTMLPYFERWTRHFPDWNALARAEENSVMRLWAGLGYYQRAHRLLALARQVSASHGGVLPDDLDTLRALPGVGPYTAASIASIAFNLPALPIDGNIRRVWTRIFADPEVSPSTQQDQRLINQLEPELARTRKRREWVQALMELGALVCTPRQPKCGECPLAQVCRAHQTQREHDFPVKAKSKRPKPLHISFAWIESKKGRVLLRQRDDKGRFPGMWEPPTSECETFELSIEALQAKLPYHALKSDEAFRRDFTSFKVTWHPHRLSGVEEKKTEGYEWLECAEVSKLNLIPVLAKDWMKQGEK